MAQRLFAQKGRDAVGVRELAAAAQVSLNTIIYHFGSKENLYKEAVTTAVGNGDSFKTMFQEYRDIDYKDKQMVADALFGIIRELFLRSSQPDVLFECDLIMQGLLGHDGELHRHLFEAFQGFEEPMADFLGKAGIHCEPATRTFLMSLIWSQMLFYTCARDYAMESLKLSGLSRAYYEDAAFRTSRLICRELDLPAPRALAEV